MNLKELKESGLIKSPAGIKFLEEACNVPENFETNSSLFGVVVYMLDVCRITLEEAFAISDAIALTEEEKGRCCY